MIRAELVNNVTKIKMARTFLGKPLYFVAAYYVDGLLIDTGCHHVSEEFIALIEKMKIEKIVNTHSHEDHIGNNHVLQERFGLDIFAHVKAIPAILNPRKMKLKLYQKIIWGTPKPSIAKKLGETIKTENFDFKVLHTPGHSDGHICLYEEKEKWIFTGDAYVGGRDKVLRSDYNIYMIIDSLRKILSYDIKLLFPSSGTILNNPKNIIKEKVEYLESLGKRILSMHEEGKNVKQIRKEIFGREGLINYVTQGHFSAENLVRLYLEDLYANV